jgi:putative DNA primase/helicase
MIEPSKPATQADSIEHFKNAMLDAGINPTEPIEADGHLHRCHLEGHAKDSRNGAYVLHLNGKRPAGWFQDFKSGVSAYWALPISGNDDTKPDKQTQAELRRQIEYARQVRAKEQAEQHHKAANKALWIWQKAEPAPADYPYLAKKRIKPHGARVFRGALVNPLVDESGALCNLQFIQPDGTKRFLSGGKKKGCFSTFGDITQTILISEGWATGASLYEQTGNHVIVAMDAGNLTPVAEVIRAKYPDAQIIIAGDNDESGVGQKAARAAALACGGKVFIPPDVGDWNDYVCQGGVING